MCLEDDDIVKSLFNFICMIKINIDRRRLNPPGAKIQHDGKLKLDLIITFTVLSRISMTKYY